MKLKFIPSSTDHCSINHGVHSKRNKCSADVITDWNQTSIEVIQAEMLVSTKASRILASVHAAMFDAVNAVNRTHQVFHVNATLSPDASAEAAAACAAYRVLLSLCPGQTDMINLALDTTLDRHSRWSIQTGWIATRKPCWRTDQRLAYDGSFNGYDGLHSRHRSRTVAPDTSGLHAGHDAALGLHDSFRS